MDTNRKITKIFVDLGNLTRMIKNDVNKGKINDYKIFIDQIHEYSIEIDDEILKNIGKIDIDDIKINLYEFKKKPHNYIEMLIGYFKEELVKFENINKEIEIAIDNIVNSGALDEHQKDAIQLYKSSLIETIFLRYRTHNDSSFELKYENQTLVLKMGKTTRIYDLKSMEEIEKIMKEREENK